MARQRTQSGFAKQNRQTFEKTTETHQLFDRGGKKRYFLKPVSPPAAHCPAPRCPRAVHTPRTGPPAAPEALTVSSRSTDSPGKRRPARRGDQRSLVMSPSWWSISQLHVSDVRRRATPASQLAASPGSLRHRYQNPAQEEHTFFLWPAWPESQQNWNSHQAFPQLFALCL